MMEIQNEDALQEEFEGAPAAEPEAEPAAEPEAEPSPEDMARSKGWVDSDEWEGDPADWKGYKAFLKDGELYDSLRQQRGEINSLKQTMSDSLKRNNTFYRAQVDTLKADREELERKLDQAVELADKDAAKELRGELRRVEGQIDEAEEATETPQVPSAQEIVQQLQTHPEIIAWQNANPWIKDGEDPRAAQASKLFAERFYDRAKVYNSLDALVEDVTQFVDREMRPKRNPNREKAPVTTGGRKTVTQGTKSGIKISDLTAEEKNIRAEFFPDLSDADYLKVVEESRL